MIRLIPKTPNVALNVNRWQIIAERDWASFLPGPGPWILIAPQNATPFDSATRWVHKTNDKNFEVIYD